MRGMRICRGALALVLCAALGCGGPPGPARPAPLAGRTQHYQPLGMKADAALPGQAVILGTDETNGSTVLPIPTTPSTAVVDAMFVERGGGAHGGWIAITLTAAPAPAAPAGRPPQTGVSDPPAGALWRAGLWRAAFVAATALGKDPGDVTVSAVPARSIDSAAAAALIAAGWLAAMTGARLDPRATLAGSLGPDGTIGPAAGIPEQFQGALAHGKTRLGYPSGMRLARSAVTGQDVDLVQLAQAHHAEAIEVANVYDAYQLLTGHPLPAPVPLSEADMALDPDTVAGLDATYLALRTRLAAEWTPLLQLEQAGRLPATIGLMTRLAQDLAEQAEALHRAGTLPAAYGRVLAAWVYAAGANATHGVLAKLAAGDVDGAVAALATGAPVDADPDVLLRELGARRPQTIGGHLGMVAAFQAALRGESYRAFGTDALRATTEILLGFKDRSAAELGSAATAERIANTVAPAVMMRFRTIAETTVATQELALEPDRGAPWSCAPPHLARMAAMFEAEAAAARRAVDARLVEPLARSAGIPVDAARRRVASVEPDYLIADALAHLPAPPAGEDSIGARLRTLAGHAAAYQNAQVLLAKYDVLAVHTGDAGRIDAVEHAGALRALLANARRTARASARAARIATGAIPVQAKLAYQLAAVEATGSLEDQLDALAELWTASAFCQLAVMLARF